MKEQEARKKVNALKGLYIEMISFIFVNMILVFIWLMLDRGEPFWPKYVIVVWGIVLAFKAYNKDIVSLFLRRLSFLTPEWEKKKVAKMTSDNHVQRKIQLNRHMSKR